MSIITQPVIVPSRVLALYRFLASRKSHAASEEDVLQTLMPDATLTGSREVLEGTIKEARKMGLLSSEAEQVHLNPDLPPELTQPGGEERLPTLVSDLVFSDANDSNHDFAYMVAWFLRRDPLLEPCDRDSVVRALDQDDPGGKRGLKDLVQLATQMRFDNFAYWSRYLGFTRRATRGRTAILMPDPTVHLKLRLDQCVPMGRRPVRLSTFFERLANYAPVFEGGRFRIRIEEVLAGDASSTRSKTELSKSTRLALKRLEDEGLLSLSYDADATDFYQFQEADDLKRISHIQRRRP